MLLNLSTGLLILNFLLFIFKISIGFQIYWLSIMIYLFRFFLKHINCFSFKFLVSFRPALNTSGFSSNLLTFLLGYQIPCRRLPRWAGCEVWV